MLSRALPTALLALAPLLAGALLPDRPAEAQTTHTVPSSWPLIPKDSSNNPLVIAGQRFRLLFVTSTKIAATSSST